MRYGLGMVLVVVAGVIWSTQGLVFRQIDAAGTWAVLFWRSVGMVPVLLAFLIWRAGGSPLPAIRAVGIAGVLGRLGLVGAFAARSIRSSPPPSPMPSFFLPPHPFSLR